MSEIESETSTSAIVETLLVVVIHDGRASAIATPAITSERSVACTTCWVSDRSVSDSTRITKNAGITATRCSHAGASKSIGFSVTWIVMLVRSAIHASTPIQIATAAAIASPSRNSGPGLSSARIQLVLPLKGFPPAKVAPGGRPVLNRSPSVIR